ncbi:glycosyltransferase involved in cell wall biosynthesis [Dysgonomonas alginatilytica]|uniref:Glycosyltransferase involved in cell wall biosynthesis n=1 Tax=Dysgonomonas alginatilytica TaxID=1605892 RepID=A0A2V3PPL9_9BACT|nr:MULTISPECIES: glycosyltransferase family 2 protein [Dysgonomonas]MBF0577892.1 glycosyltransferase family 2 protein [Dysgonomonas sp. GY617]PXV63317.1 glycosyltransferase involved in cell wall biosynthesis [Dysgonomonas alginatilytica]
MDKISAIVPCYNEEQALPYLYEELVKVAQQMNGQDFEFIFVNDGSKDKTLQVIKELRKKDDRVRYVSFSRNFGKEAAIYAGLEAATGDYVAMLDADLQDPPHLLVEMYESLKTEDFDCVATRREDRKGEPIIRSFFAKQFYQLINKISDTEIVDGARDFRLMSRAMVNSILQVGEYNRFSKGIFGWVGFNTKWIAYENVERVAGETKWSFWGLFFYSLEGIIAFSTRPLAIASVFGFVFFLISLVWICMIITKTLLWGDPVPGYPSLICAIFFIGGIQLLCLGILGQYLSKTYLETKKRPIYIAKETETTA